MKLLLKRLHSYLLAFSMAFFFFLLWPPLYYCSLKPERYKGMITLRRIWAFLSSRILGITYKFEFEQPIDWGKTYIVCPHHTSNLDIPAMSLLFKDDNCCFMGKEELLDGLITAIYFRTVDIPVNRDSKMSSFRAFKAASEKIKNGINMIMFPEGGIADDYPPKLQPFKNGPFRLAIELNTPIIPISSLNIWRLFWDNGHLHGSKPGTARYFVHQPIETAHLTIADADWLRDEVYGIIQNKFNQKSIARTFL